ncbi:AEC family transporter [Thalassospiraceae bacterium LMO-SO8]|nr:AEC family transporter [Alphaproteobacteria bacterium LMO-S08]WND76879.1 AEC family transporter [Thalassospiraceae bacterium LMO-SO8]
MLNILWSILPIFVLIVLGNLLRRGGIPSVTFWNLNDKLVYWVLFPSLLFYKTSTTDLAGGVIGPLAAIILSGLVAAVAVSLILGLALGFNRPQATSILQGSARHNTFIALAIAERLFGTEGLAVAALCTSVLVPPTNVLVISLMNILLRQGSGSGLWAPVARDLARNPLILSVGLGIGVNYLGAGEIPVVHEVTGMLGRAALPIVLLAVGANIRLHEMKASASPIAVATLVKFLVFPAAAWAMCWHLGVTGVPAYVITIFAVMPMPPSSFTIAREMGGDAPLAASMVTVQTLLSLITVPVSLVIAQNLF